VIEVIGDDGSKRQLRFKKAMIATGASAAIAPVPGLKDCEHLTNGNFFNLTTMPPRMVVIGSGPIGLELSQSMARFGCKVTCLEMAPRLLTREDPDAAALLCTQLERDGVNVMTSVKILSVSRSKDGNLYQAPYGTYEITLEKNGETITLQSEALLNATGRAPNVHDVGLEAVGVDWDNRRGVSINDMFQTSHPDIYACGDCASAYKFTHSAEHQARMAIRNMFLGDTNKLSDLLIPWCTYTEPEIAHVGKYESELTSAGIKFESFVKQLKDVDRCMCDGTTEGFVKITIEEGTDKIIGATICGPNAGDMISEITVCMQHGIGLTQLAGVIHPYPTQQEAVRHACLGYNKYLKNPNGPALGALKMAMQEKEGIDAAASNKNEMA
jgi:pyruvate/2-oxoglutarate dehydrogenase complex dihydrolipoamide dehydrogenase (E3) component